MFKNIIYAPRRAGKTTALDGIIKNLAMQPNQRILYYSTHYLAEKLMYNCLLNYYIALDLVMKAVTDTDNVIFLSNGTQIHVGKNRDVFRGQKYDLICLDDAEGISDLNELLNFIETNSNDETRCWLTISPESYHVTN